MKAYELENLKKIVSMGEFFAECASSAESALSAIGGFAQDEVTFNSQNDGKKITIALAVGDNPPVRVVAPAKWSCLASLCVALQRCAAQASSALESIQPVQAVELAVATAKEEMEAAAAAAIIAESNEAIEE